MDPEIIIEALDEVVASSARLSSIAFLTIGASLLAVFSTSYRRPSCILMKLTYLLYVPAWTALGWSVYFGDEISRRNIAAKFTQNTKDENVLSNISQFMNETYINQTYTLFFGVLFFVIWAIGFLLYFVFSGDSGFEKD